MPLTDARIRNLQPKPKQYKVSDGGGLRLAVLPSGAKSWRMKYRYAGREDQLIFGLYPAVTLREARERRDKAKRLLRENIDPKVQQKAACNSLLRSFKIVAEELLRTLSQPRIIKKGKKVKIVQPLSAKTLEKKNNWLTVYVYPYIGNRPIAQITSPELLAVLRKVEALGYIETAHRIRALCSTIFAFGIASGDCASDPAAPLVKVMVPVMTEHHAALTDPRQVGELLFSINAYEGRGRPLTKLALQLEPLVFLRNSELRKGEWSEIDFDAAEWRIPAERMKMPDLFIVPLSTQALAILEELHKYTGTERFLFPNQVYKDRPMRMDFCTKNF